MRTLVASLRERARILKQDGVALWLAARDPRTPLLAKLIVVAIVAYVVSPIDLIPDFIPVVGLLDEVLLVPLAIRLALRLVPPAVLREARLRAPIAWARVRRAGQVGAVAVVAIWVAVLGVLAYGVAVLVAGGM